MKNCLSCFIDSQPVLKLKHALKYNNWAEMKKICLIVAHWQLRYISAHTIMIPLKIKFILLPRSALFTIKIIIPKCYLKFLSHIRYSFHIALNTVSTFSLNFMNTDIIIQHQSSYKSKTNSKHKKKFFP